MAEETNSNIHLHVRSNLDGQRSHGRQQEKCKICGTLCANIKAYIKHCLIHKNEHNVRFPCAQPGCLKTCATYKGLLTHMSRKHECNHSKPGQSRDKPYIDASISIKCSLLFCQSECADIQELLAHLRNHIVDGMSVLCPFSNCEKKFNNKKSFSSHLSRYQRDYTAYSVKPALIVQGDQLTPNVHVGFSEVDSDLTEESHNESEDFQDDNDSGDNIAEYTRNIALFLLKLLAKYLVPESTIQTIVEEMYGLYKLSRECAAKHVQKTLQDANILNEELTKDILDGVAELGCSLAPLEDSSKFVSPQCGVLRSTFLRKNYFKRTFSYVAPIEINLGRDSSGKSYFFHYVPILETLKVICQDKSVQKHFVSTRLENGLGDISDGQIYQQCAFFKENPEALQIILYQDSFEIVNPLGSARTKHKILAVYYTLGNIDVRFRSQVDQMQLVLLCKEKTVKQFGQEALFSKLVGDLKKLEQEGISVNGNLLKGSLLAILGDNLGAHFIGGFCESFNAENYCRFCLRTKTQIREEPPYVEGEYRSPESYDRSVRIAQETQATSHAGVKFDSSFNSLSYFHVASPGLPPCLAHDLFEGVLDYDLAMFLQYFVDSRWFTFDLLNDELKRFPFSTSDSKDVMHSVRKGEKIGGQAVENWYFLRFFPMIVFSFVSDPENPVWELMLKLKSIVEIVVSPMIDHSELAYLKVLVEEYLEDRRRLFPDKRLRPKHHFLSHYPWLILKFGPLTRVWTLRFESKHVFFKRCVRYSSNFKNVTATLTERHQLMQAYFCDGQLFPDSVKADRGTEFDPSLYATNIQRAVHSRPILQQNCEASDEVTVFGTRYRKGMYVVVKHAKSWTFACILLVLVSGETVNFVARQCQYTYHIKYGLYEVYSDSNSNVVCIEFKGLADYFPLTAYRIRGSEMITLKNKPMCQK
ncbi:uncharacterized protein LOC764597 isoform X1 [Strongylocentrotus purpuratus]|uniref:C2H2-type domain-containing protein n=1 Tax=Strongylocentrotus purpuratus TaxID=7668 RepID=A0A7M7NDD7_STRPU|nr:uncharacterized protein LOC764597 isoform X1 [Strongylocentrotus purpuratus]